MTTKKICFIVADAGSFNVLFRDQLEYFKNNSDFDITLICGGNQQQLDTLSKRKVGKVVNTKFRRKPSLFNDAKSFLHLTGYLSLNRFDVVVYSTPKALLLCSMSSFITLQNKRIAVVHGRAYENYIGFKRYIFQRLDKISFFASHDIIFVSKSLCQNYINEKIIDKKLAKIIGSGSFNGVNTNVFKPISLERKLELREKFNIPVNSFSVCIVGRICTEKGTGDIEELVKILNSDKIFFFFVGSFEDEESKNIVEKIVASSRGIYMPFTLNIHEVFQSSDLHLFLSHREGFGNVAIEAASCGIPTFAYDVVGVKDSVNNKISGQRFEFRDTAAIANAISEAATDVKFCQKYPNARDWVIENFEQEAVWQKYLNFYLQNL